MDSLTQQSGFDRLAPPSSDTRVDMPAPMLRWFPLTDHATAVPTGALSVQPIPGRYVGRHRAARRVTRNPQEQQS